MGHGNYPEAYLTLGHRIREASVLNLERRVRILDIGQFLVH